MHYLFAAMPSSAYRSAETPVVFQRWARRLAASQTVQALLTRLCRPPPSRYTKAARHQASTSARKPRAQQVLQNELLPAARRGCQRSGGAVTREATLYFLFPTQRANPKHDSVPARPASWSCELATNNQSQKL